MPFYAPNLIKVKVVRLTEVAPLVITVPPGGTKQNLTFTFEVSDTFTKVSVEC